MAGWNLEWIYKSNGSELNTAVHTSNLASATHMAYDGRYLWVTGGTQGVFIYEFWGAASDHEPAWSTLDELVLPRYDSNKEQKLRLVTKLQITSTQLKRTTREASLKDVGATQYDIADGEKAYSLVTARTGDAMNAQFICKLGSKMYVTSGQTFTTIYEFDIATQQPDATPVLDVTETFNDAPRGMTSNLVASGGRLWFVGGYSIDEEQDAVRQKLYALNPLTGTRTAYDIAARPSLSRSWLADGLNGFVYMTLYNDVGVYKVNNLTGSGTIIRTNAFPTRIFSNQDRKIFVNSYAGMLTLVDWDDDGVHNDYSTEEAGAPAFAVDPADSSKLWYVSADGKLVRYDLNTLKQLEQGDGTQDWHFQHPRLTAPENLLITAQQTYSKPDGTSVTVKPYIFMIDSDELRAFRLDTNYLWREAYYQMTGQAAVASGVEKYFGEE